MTNLNFRVGDRAVIQHMNYGQIQFIDAKVIKVLKTRVVVEFASNRRSGFDTDTMRFVVPTYGATLYNEGYRQQTWTRQYYMLLADNEQTAARRDAARKQERIEVAEHKARAAAAGCVKSGHISDGDAELVILRMQQLLEARAANKVNA